MATLIYLDTHVVAWLYAGETQRIPVPASQAIRDGEVLVSPIVLLELQYLIEIERFTDSVEQVLQALGRDLGLKVCDLPFPQVTQYALGATWTRDPFDRLIVSQAALQGAPLITKDRKIQQHYPNAIWDL